MRGTVKGGYAQRLDQVLQNHWPQGLAQPGHAVLLGAGKALPLPAGSGVQQTPFFAPAPALGAGNGAGSSQRCKSGWAQLQAMPVWRAQVQRQALQHGFWRCAQGAHQAQRVGVSADQNVLAVVQHAAIDFVASHAARAPACGAAGFEHGHARTHLHGAHGCCATGPAGTDDGNVRGRLSRRG